MSDLSQTLLDEKSVDFKKEVNLWLRKSISYHDENENFYHWFLAGLLIGFEKYVIKYKVSNNWSINVMKPCNRSKKRSKQDNWWTTVIRKLRSMVKMSMENVKCRRKRKRNCIKISVLWQIKTRSKPEHFVQI